MRAIKAAMDIFMHADLAQSNHRRRLDMFEAACLIRWSHVCSFYIKGGGGKTKKSTEKWEEAKKKHDSNLMFKPADNLIRGSKHTTSDC